MRVAEDVKGVTLKWDPVGVPLPKGWFAGEGIVGSGVWRRK